MRIKEKLISNKTIGPIIIAIWKIGCDIILYQRTKKVILASNNQEKRIFYLGVPVHNNLGDLAQGICIREFLNKHYSNYKTIEIETNALVNTKMSVLNLLKKNYRDDDFIVFQSGYTTTDLGGHADEMHRAVMRKILDAKFLMFPQTIFFKSEENKKRTSEIYNNARRMLFLARDRISYDMAKEMFPDIFVTKYPDIVTTMIGTLKFNYKREGILFCCRDDEEKYYSDSELEILIKKCSSLTKVVKTDTTKKGNRRSIVANAKEIIHKEIENYAHYKIIITDRYHGTIFSLIAGTPVIIIKSNDHKVVTGAEWFKGIYDDYVYLAENLDDAYELVQYIFSRELKYRLYPYFEKEYYEKLPKLFEEIQ